MLNLGASTRVFLALDPVDMRGSFDALAGHVRRLNADPLDGHLYFFVNRRRKLMKTLWFDPTGGWCIFSKRLEKGTFELPAVDSEQRRVAIDPVQFAMIVDGIELSARRRPRYRHPPGSS